MPKRVALSSLRKRLTGPSNTPARYLLALFQTGQRARVDVESLAASFCDSPRAVRRRTSRPAVVFASGKGLKPRKRMMAGMYRISGFTFAPPS